MPEINKISELDLQLVIIRHCLPLAGKLIIPNVSFYYGEADVLQISKAGYVTEFEVKISRSDFFADRKKVSKHNQYRTVFNKDLPATQGLPNYFVYVVPERLNLQASDVPEYAGLYSVGDNTYGYLHTVKTPPRIHKENFKEFWTHKIAHSFNAKYLYHHFFKIVKQNGKLALQELQEVK
jgi:hypothetical protein